MSNANVSFKYNTSDDELKISLDTETAHKKSDETPQTAINKNEKASVSLLDKYFKSFKHEKHVEDSKVNTDKDIPEKKLPEKENREVSGSPIKDYFQKLSKRPDSADTNCDSEVFKEHKGKDLHPHDKWKLFSEIKGKIAQAVEDIKSSKSEGVERNNSVESDSEDNSILQDFDHSCASTENQVSSLASSVQNLSDLSPPLLSQSSTMTDSQEENTSSSNATNKNLVTPIKTKKDEEIKDPDADFLDDEEDNIDLEIESGVDALEDFNLVHIKGDNTIDTISRIDRSNSNESKYNQIQRKPFFTFTFVSLTTLVIASLAFFSTFLMFNGFLIGIWFVSFMNNFYQWTLNYFGFNKLNQNNYNFDMNPMKLNKINQIVEFEPLKKYEGWINLYTLGTYDPLTYHISQTHTVFLKLEGCQLRLSFASSKISRRAHHDEKINNVDFYQHKLYDLEGAQVKLLPAGIIKKRYWSKKYPICIVLKDKSKVVIYNAQSGSIDSNSSLPTKDEIKTVTEDDSAISSKTSETESTPKKQQSESILNVSKSNKKQTGPDGKVTEKSNIIEAIKEYHHSPAKTKKLEDSEFMDADDEFEDFSEDPPIDTTTLCSNETNEMGDEESNEESRETVNNEELDFNADDGKWSKNEIQNLSEEETVLYLFARTGRDKEEWFHRFKTAIEDVDTINNLKSAMNATTDQDDDFGDDIDSTKSDITSESRRYNSESRVQLSSTKIEKKLIGSSDMPSVLWTPAKTVKDSPLTEAFHCVQEVDFWKYMKDIIKNKEKSSEPSLGEMTWLNALIGRMIYDTFRNPVWVSEFQERIQKKLSTLKMPSFMGPLVVTALDLGCDAPKFHEAALPILDGKGLWIYLQMSYTGHATMTLTTQLNLMSLKEKKQNDDSSHIPSPKKSDRAIYDPDVEDSAESSSEDEAGPSQSISLKTNDTETSSSLANQKESSSKKLLRFVDKIAANKYFQHVTEYKYVKRAMEEVSNTDLKLSVELRSLSGCLTLNLPPSPSDRIWIGFKGNPNLCLRAKPIVGSHVINFTHVTNWIEKRLCSEFEKLLVLPNMEDINLDCMMARNID